MKKILFIVLVNLNLTLIGQVHQIGIGIGQGDGIDDRRYEGFYSFNYKLFYTKLNYIYTPTKTYEYKNTSQTTLFLEIQSHPDLKVIGHIGFGARAYFPTKNDTYSLNREQDEAQINLFFNTGVSYEFIRRHCFYYDIYIGGVRRKFKHHGYNGTETNSDFMMTLGYAYTFRKNRQKS